MNAEGKQSLGGITMEGLRRIKSGGGTVDDLPALAAALRECWAALEYGRDQADDVIFVLDRLLDSVGGLSVDHRQRLETVRRHVNALKGRAAEIVRGAKG